MDSCIFATRAQELRADGIVVAVVSRRRSLSPRFAAAQLVRVNASREESRSDACVLS
jgi:hypothetical protein